MVQVAPQFRSSPPAERNLHQAAMLLWEDCEQPFTTVRPRRGPILIGPLVYGLVLFCRHETPMRRQTHRSCFFYLILRVGVWTTAPAPQTTPNALSPVDGDWSIGRVGVE